MGIPPSEVDRQSIWQFSSAWNGYVAANSPDNGKLTERQIDELFAWIDEAPARPNYPTMPDLLWDGEVLSSPRS